MLHQLKRQARFHANDGRPVDIAGIVTAVPPHVISQEDAATHACERYPQFARLSDLFANTGIARRHTVEPREWYGEPRTWRERTASFQRHALPLLEDVARRSVAMAGLSWPDVDIVITNTITGLAIPSLEGRLMNRLDFRADVERLPIFGLGCGGGVAGLARAERMASPAPGRSVLFLTIDLCSLCMRINDASLAMFVSSALFADGAVGVVLTPRTEASADAPGLGRIVTTGEYFWRETEHIMGWDILDDGFGVVLSPELPSLMRNHLGEAVDHFLDRSGIARADIDGFLIHPGGAKVLETAAEVLSLSHDDLSMSWDVLRDYGNMSSASALFVLNQAIESGARGRHLLMAFGPGFSAYFVVVDL
ncbi:MAG: type III polyketide synthase [Dichotomicrobium sp.]